MPQGQVQTPSPVSQVKLPQSALELQPADGWQVWVTLSQLFEAHWLAVAQVSQRFRFGQVQTPSPVSQA